MNKKKRAPGAGRKRGPTLPKIGALVQTSPVKVPEETLNFLNSLDVAKSDYIREAIQEKREREQKKGK